MSAIDRFRSYLVDHPGDRFALYSLAFALVKAGRSQEAMGVFGELLAAHPTSGAGHYQLGLLHSAAGRLTEAQTAWQAGLDALAGESGPDARKSRAEIQAALDQVEDQLDDLD